ncbi:MAG: sodium:solute symporter, partial [Flavobacteriaceae bacterium]
INIIGSLFYGTILGIFLIAIFFKTIKANAVFWPALVTEAILLIVFNQDVVSFLWLNVIGAVLMIVMASLTQLFLKVK